MRADAGLAILLAGLVYAWWPPAAPERGWWLLAWVIFSTTALWLTRPRPAQNLRACQAPANRPQIPLGAELAHDFRTPLMRLRLQLSAVADGGSAVTAEQFAAMEAEVLQLERLAEDFVDLTSADAAWPRDAEGPLDLTRAAWVEVERLRPLFELQGRPIEAHLEPTRPVRCSLARFQRMLGNILSNTLRYSEGQGPVSIRLSMDGPLFVRLGVENPAPRPSQDPDSLAAAFVRGAGAMKSQGFGLGLAVARRLAGISDGRLRLAYREADGVFETILLFPRADEMLP